MAERHGLPILWPTWPQIAPGPLLRGDPPRFYSGLFTPVSPRYISGVAKIRVLAEGKRVPEAGLSESDAARQANTIYEFAGMRNYFSAILHDHAMVRMRLLEITRRHHRPATDCTPPHIGVHVRLGDFSRPGSAEELRNPRENINLRLPIDWYVHMIRLLREGLADPLPVRVFSDGTDQELAPLLKMYDVGRAGGKSPLADLLSLSQASALIASGSTFSMWASYLGRMPVLWYPGRIRQRLYAERPWEEVEVERDGRLTRDFVESTRRPVLA